jgi:phospholipid/cholesterol/gamma-HCH transport system substrate-binding protein
MEIRARYVLVGIFVLAAIVAGGGFVYWLWGFGGFNEKTAYAVRFNGPISGLLTGSEVLFNGIAVGEVTGLSLDRAKPSDVIVTISVDKSAPVRADTRATLAFSGLTGAARINLIGGSDSAPPAAQPSPGSPPAIAADNASLADLTQSARGTLGNIDQVIADNADSLHSAIASVDAFAGALARNADKIDSIIGGLSQLTGGGAAAMNYALRDLPAATPAKPARLPAGQLVVARPTAVVALATQRVLLAGPNGDAPVFDEVRWADSLPIVVQARVIQTFENAGYVKVVSDAGVAMGDFQLDLDLRAFHIAPAPAPAAEVAIAAKLLDADGKVIDAMTFTDREAVAKTDDSATAVAALSAAFAKVSADLSLWTLATMTRAEASAPPAPTAPPAAPATPPSAAPALRAPLDLPPAKPKAP